MRAKDLTKTEQAQVLASTLNENPAVITYNELTRRCVRLGVRVTSVISHSIPVTRESGEVCYIWPRYSFIDNGTFVHACDSSD